MVVPEIKLRLPGVVASPLIPLSLHTGPNIVDLSASATLMYYPTVAAIARTQAWLCFGVTSSKVLEVPP